MTKSINNPIQEYFYSNQKKIIHKWNHYFEIYHHHFQRFIGKKCILIEIGVGQGGSLQMWKSYLGEHARIIGIDINPDCKQFEEENIEIFIGSQSDKVFLDEIIKKIPKFDILIDDGGHLMNQQIIAFEVFYNHLNDNGVYICEDTHTSYWKDYGGGIGKRDTFIEFSKKLIDQLNAWHIPNNEMSASNFTRNTNSIHFYDSMVVFEKRNRVQPWSEMTGFNINTKNRNVNIEYIERFRLKLKLLGVNFPENNDAGVFIYNEKLLQSYLGALYDGTIWPENGETMIGFKRLTNIEECIIDVLKNNIQGDFIETGVWRGGACIFMSLILQQFNNSDKIVWLADSFQGLPKPNPDKYPEDINDNLFTYSELAVSEDEVLINFKKYNIQENRFKFLKGWFKNTLVNSPINNLSILRLDGDMYESTIDVLYYLYPKLSIGGFCIIDDWGAIPACRKAVEDYCSVMDINEKKQIIDWTGIYWKKEKQVNSISRTEFEDILTK